MAEFENKVVLVHPFIVYSSFSAAFNYLSTSGKIMSKLPKIAIISDKKVPFRQI